MSSRRSKDAWRSDESLYSTRWQRKKLAIFAIDFRQFRYFAINFRHNGGNGGHFLAIFAIMAKIFAIMAKIFAILPSIFAIMARMAKKIYRNFSPFLLFFPKNRWQNGDEPPQSYINSKEPYFWINLLVSIIKHLIYVLKELLSIDVVKWAKYLDKLMILLSSIHFRLKEIFVFSKYLYEF